MIRKKILVVVSILVVLGLMLGGFGCAAPAPTPKPAPKSTPTATPTTAPTPPPQVFTMKVSGQGTKEHPNTLYFERFMKLVEERAKGRVKFENFPNGSLYGSTDTGKAITGGVIQLGMVSMGYLGKQLGAAADAYMAPLTTSWKAFNTNYRKSWLPWVQKKVETKEVNWRLFAYPQHGTTNLASRKPIKTPEDFKGKLIRGTAAQAEALRLIGASPIDMDTSAIFEALQRGSLDGATGSYSFIKSAGLHEVAPYVIGVDMYPAAWGHIMPLDYYNSLPADLRKIFDDASVEAEAGINHDIEVEQNKTLDVFKANPKVTVIFFNDAQLKQLMDMMQPFHVKMTEKHGDDWKVFMDIVKKDKLGG